MSDHYGPGGAPPQVTPSGSSMLDRGYGNHQPAPTRIMMPGPPPTTAIDSPAATPAGVGPLHLSPPGPLGPLS